MRSSKYYTHCSFKQSIKISYLTNNALNFWPCFTVVEEAVYLQLQFDSNVFTTTGAIF